MIHGGVAAPVGHKDVVASRGDGRVDVLNGRVVAGSHLDRPEPPRPIGGGGQLDPVAGSWPVGVPDHVDEPVRQAAAGQRQAAPDVVGAAAYVGGDHRLPAPVNPAVGGDPGDQLSTAARDERAGAVVLAE